MSENQIDDEREQFAYLGALANSGVLIRRLTKEVLRVAPMNLTPGALSYHEGRRSLASEILALLNSDKQLGDRSGSTGHDNGRGRGNDNPGVGLQRRVPIEPELGYGRGPRPVRKRRSS